MIPLFRKICVACALLAMMVVDASAQHREISGRVIYYSNAFAGDRMACGPRYQPWKLVAAHRHLPCGTRLEVKNRANGETVIVTVQDRGPYTHRYNLDVSRRAARKLGFVDEGSARYRALILH